MTANASLSVWLYQRSMSLKLRLTNATALLTPCCSYTSTYCPKTDWDCIHDHHDLEPISKWLPNNVDTVQGHCSRQTELLVTIQWLTSWKCNDTLDPFLTWLFFPVSHTLATVKANNSVCNFLPLRCLTYTLSGAKIQQILNLKKIEKKTLCLLKCAPLYHLENLLKTKSEERHFGK